MTGEFQGVIGRTLEQSTPWWPPLPQRAGPNVVVVLLDDVGFAQFGCYGSDIATPTFDRMAAGGLRYSGFHTTALCSPTRACLLTGRNHHASGMGRIVEFASGFPGYNATMPKENGMAPEILVRNGYATFCVGKWHLAPATETMQGGPRDRWPLGRGFERYYGFLHGETDQYHPDLIHDNHEVDPPSTPDDGYHLTEDLADHAIQYLKDLRAASTTRPFFLWFAPGACHSPHQAPAAYINAYRGQFDEGWDNWREQVFARQQATGLSPAGARLSERPKWVPEWDSLSRDERRLYARMMEVYAGFLTHTDAQVGRVIDFVDGLGELDDTIVVVMSDNGASAEGGPRGSYNEMYFFNFVPESFEENLRRIDDLGTPRAHNHYPWGWAWAGNTPFKRWKRETHEGGVADPLIVHWPNGIRALGETRHQYVHAIDLLPTLLDMTGIEAPTEIGGVTQTPFDGVSFAHTFDAPDAPSRRVTQYYEMLGCRAMYHEGWKAVVFHPMPTATYDGDPDRSFEEDAWELYHVAEDPCETVDLAVERPDKLAELVDLWWEEAARNKALPVTNLPGRHLDRRHRRERYELHPGIGSMPEAVAPNLRNRGWRMLVTVDAGESADSIAKSIDGVVMAHGSAAGGYAIYVKDRRLSYVHNRLGAELTTVTADVEIPDGETILRVEFTSTGPHEGNVDLFYGDLPVAEGHITAMTPITYGMAGFTVGHQRGSPITPAYEPPFAFSDGALGVVVVEAEGRAPRNPQAEQRAGQAMQ